MMMIIIMVVVVVLLEVVFADKYEMLMMVKIEWEQEEAAGHTYAAPMYRSSSLLPVIIVMMTMVKVSLIMMCLEEMPPK